jgi:protein polybromo-1
LYHNYLRAPPAQPSDDEDDDEDDLDRTNSDTEASGGKAGARKTSGLLALMWSLYDYAKDYKNGAQTLIDPFMKLPSKRIYPDYYDEIKKPIAMNTIKRSLSKRQYKSIKEMSDDLELMCANAMQYNVEESVIYGNAKKLLEAVRHKASEIGLLAASLPPESIVPKSSPASTPKKEKAASHAALVNKSGAKQTKAGLVEHNMKRLFKLVIEYCGGEEEAAGGKSNSNQTIPGGRANNKSMLSQPFMSLPSRELQPDYYEKIRDPLDFNTVRRRIESGAYSTEGDMVVDCVKVLENAKSYYSESTQFHKDAHKLKSYLNKKYQLFLNRQNFGVGDEAELFNTAAPSSSTLLLPKFNDLKDKLLFLYGHINDYQIDQRELAYPFRHLPSKTEYPDYYNVIKKPIDMTKIMHKINQLGHASYSYTSVDDMCVDFGQMFENACVYNEPTSTLYKDALNLQRALFLKRDEMVQHELGATSSSYENFNETLHESLPADFVSRAVHELVESLFDSCMQYQDMEGRVLSETFVDLYDLFDRMNSANILTFDMIQKRVKERAYKRMDVFQEEMFEVFNQVRSMSYYEALSSSDQQAWVIEYFLLNLNIQKLNFRIFCFCRKTKEKREFYSLV